MAELLLRINNFVRDNLKIKQKVLCTLQEWSMVSHKPKNECILQGKAAGKLQAHGPWSELTHADIHGPKTRITCRDLEQPNSTTQNDKAVPYISTFKNAFSTTQRNLPNDVAIGRWVHSEDFTVYDHHVGNNKSIRKIGP